jgi:hypothetical protein
MNVLLCLGFFQVIPVRRPWDEVLKAAATNYFALAAFAIILGGSWLLFRAKDWRKKDWRKVVGALAVLAGAYLMMMVLRDIRSEIPRRVSQANFRVCHPERRTSQRFPQALSS